MLYIGGASSSSSLLSCQETDGANEARMAVPDGKGIDVKKSNRKLRILLEMSKMRYQHRFLEGA